MVIQKFSATKRKEEGGKVWSCEFIVVSVSIFSSIPTKKIAKSKPSEIKSVVHHKSIYISIEKPQNRRWASFLLCCDVMWCDDYSRWTQTICGLVGGIVFSAFLVNMCYKLFKGVVWTCPWPVDWFTFTFTSDYANLPTSLCHSRCGFMWM